jgi:hypothetical protein
VKLSHLIALPTLAITIILSAEEKPETLFWRNALSEKIKTEQELAVLENMLETFDRESRYEGDGRSFPQWAIDAALWIDNYPDKEAYPSPTEITKRDNTQTTVILAILLTGLFVVGSIQKNSSLTRTAIIGLCVLVAKMAPAPGPLMDLKSKWIRYSIVNHVLRIMGENNIKFDQKALDRIQKLCTENPRARVVDAALLDICRENNFIAPHPLSTENTKA